MSDPRDELDGRRLGDIAAVLGMSAEELRGRPLAPSSAHAPTDAPTAEGLALMKAFLALRDPIARSQVVILVQALAAAEICDHAFDDRWSGGRQRPGDN